MTALQHEIYEILLQFTFSDMYKGNKSILKSEI